MDELRRIISQHCALFNVTDNFFLLANTRKKISVHSKSVICCIFPYLVKTNNRRNLSYYACVPDYHTIIMGILTNACTELSLAFPNNFFTPFVDNSPFDEVAMALNSGLGVLGDNSLLITKKYGSYVFLSEIVTDLIVQLPEQVSDTNVATNTNSETIKRCLRCGLCSKNCPTQSIKDGKINSRTCLSAITQHKGELSDSEVKLIKENGLVWGCDRCQEVCPLNKDVPNTPIFSFINNANHFINLKKLPEYLPFAAYGWRGEEVISRNIQLFL